jgi:hypothetical protein
MSLVHATPLAAPLHPFLASGRLEDLPAPQEIEPYALLYVLGPVLDLFVEEDQTSDVPSLRLTWQVRLPTLPAAPDAIPVSFVCPPGVHSLPCGSLPDVGPADVPLAERARQALSLVFGPEARAKIHGVFALARLGIDRIRRRARLSARRGAGLFLSHGAPPATVVPLLEGATEVEMRRLLLHVGQARGLLNGQIVDPVGGVDIFYEKDRSAHEILADRAAAAALLDAARISLDRLPSRSGEGTSI